MKWDEVRSRFDRHFANQVMEDGLSEQQSIDAYQAELLKLYDRWVGVNTEVSMQGDSV